MPGTKELIEAAEESLESLSDLAVADLPSFENLVNPAAGDGPRDRFEQYKESGRHDPGPVPPIFDVNAWSSKSLEMLYTRVMTAEAAACTNFAFAAAYLLDLRQRLDKTDARLEIVGWSGQVGIAHVYVIVGRKPAFAGGKAAGYPLADRSQWGDDWYFVDGWAGALGWDVVYERGKHYPFPGMADKLKLVVTNKSL